MAVGFGIIGAVLLLGALGYVLDRAMDATPWFLITGLGIGLVLGLVLLAASIKRPGGKRHA
jgi:F0F1-type ATP synthase assembly protein I